MYALRNRETLIGRNSLDNHLRFHLFDLVDIRLTTNGHDLPAGIPALFSFRIHSNWPLQWPTVSIARHYVTGMNDTTFIANLSVPLIFPESWSFRN